MPGIEYGPSPGDLGPLAPVPTGTPASGIEEVDFTFGTTSPVVLMTLAAGDQIRDVTLKIITPFSVGATLTIGFSADPSEIMAADDNNPQVAGQYRVLPNRDSVGTETLNLYISGAPAAGVGKVYIET